MNRELTCTCVFSLSLSQKIENEWGCIWGPWGDGVSLSSAGRRRGTYTVCPSHYISPFLVVSRKCMFLIGCGVIALLSLAGYLLMWLRLRLQGWQRWRRIAVGCVGAGKAELTLSKASRTLYQPVGEPSLATPRRPSGGGTVLAGRLRCYSFP